VSSTESEPLSPAELVVDTRRNRRPTLVALRGELDLVTVSKVAEGSLTSSRAAPVSGTSCWTYAA
jgi:hypothetical protein